MPAAYPGWRELVRLLCDKCGVAELKTPHADCAETLIDKAQECKEADQAKYEAVLEEAYGRPVVQNREAYAILRQLPFKAYVTTNYDPLLAHGKCDPFAWRYLPIAELENRRKPVFYLHGCARNLAEDWEEPTASHLILARKDFEAAYRQGSPLTSFLGQLFAFYDVIFWGCTLSEPAFAAFAARMRDVVTEIKGQFEKWRPVKKVAILSIPYASVPTAKHGRCYTRDFAAEDRENERLTRLGIEPLRYEPADSTLHYEIEQILRCVARRVGVKLPAPSPLHFEPEDMPYD